MVQCSGPKDRGDSSDEYEIAEPQQKEQVVHTIEIKDMKFIPETLNVHKGDKVIWVNKDIVEHDVTELTKKEWASSKLAKDASWSLVVTKSENYYCNLHVVMRGKIQVEGEPLAIVIGSSSVIPICR
jgi:plastocyanin